jgi:enolase
MSRIADVHAREILDSRGNPTVEVEVVTDSGALGRALVPSGASTGTHEAVELRDGGERFLGKGVRKAVGHVQGELAKAVVGLDVFDQAGVDGAMCELDGTPNKGRLGANALLGVSLATARAAADDLGVPLHLYLGGAQGRVLPVPLMNILNGGAHADSNVRIQEFMVAPVGADSFAEALRMGVEVYHSLKKTLKGAGLATAVGDEGGFAPNLPSNVAALEHIAKATKAAGYELGSDLVLALDVASNELFDAKKKVYDFGTDGKKDADKTVAFYESMADRFPIASIEDGLAEDDHKGWQLLTKRMGAKTQLVGDDLFVTNPARLFAGIRDREANSILVKVNQIGTLTETLDVIRMAGAAGYSSVISHRSGETEDATIAHIAVATNAGQIKTGAPARSDRVAKYNELLRIEEGLGAAAAWRGPATFARFA